MGPSYQGATVSLGVIKFSTAMHLSGLHLDNIGGVEHKDSLQAAPAKAFKVKAIQQTTLLSLKTVFLFLYGSSELLSLMFGEDTNTENIHQLNGHLHIFLL